LIGKFDSQNIRLLTISRTTY